MNQLERRAFEGLVAREAQVSFGFNPFDESDWVDLGVSIWEYGSRAYHIANKVKEIYDILDKYAHVACVARIAPTVYPMLSTMAAKVTAASASPNAAKTLDYLKDVVLEPILVSLRECKGGQSEQSEQTDDQKLAKQLAEDKVRWTAERKRLEAIPAPTDAIQALKVRVITLLDSWIQTPQNAYWPLGNLLMFSQYRDAFETAARNYVPPKEITPDPAEEAAGPNKPLLIAGAVVLGFALLT